MRSGYTGHVTSSEWRWVILVGSALIVLAFIPFMWVILDGIVNTRWEFMGALHDYEDGAVYLSHVLQGSSGRWLSHILHTPETHGGTFFDFLYTLIGQLSRLLLLPPAAAFHISRIAASLFMYMALYQLASSIWMRLRTRRIFFALVVAGAGLGWLFGPLTGDASYLDLTAPEVFPFYSTLVNTHLPLALGCLALLASVIIPVFRPGATDQPTVENAGILIFFLGLTLVLIYPIALFPVVMAFVLNLLVHWYKTRDNMSRELRWLMWFIVPALPVAVYYFAVLDNNPVMAQVWRQQNNIAGPAPHVLVLSFGLPLVMALPGIYRAVRRFEPDGDQFMLLWLLSMLSLVYLPTMIERHFTIGMMIPLAYFATRSLEDFWFKYISRRWRFRLLVALIPILAAGHLFILFLPIRPLLREDIRQISGMVLERDYATAFSWLRRQIRQDDVVLAAPSTGVWVPAWTGGHVIYGHPVNTVESHLKRRAVIEWFRSNNLQACSPLLTGSYSYQGTYTVRYVIIGPQENALGNTVCISLLEPLQTFGSVRIYTYLPPDVRIPIP